MIGKTDADRKRERTEACAPETGHIYRDMGHGKRAMRQTEREQTRELIGYILQHTVGRQIRQT